MLTRKYYKQIAEVINENSCKDGIINGLCFLFKKDNPNFNKERFIEVCRKEK